jgi:hypothetical protein
MFIKTRRQRHVLEYDHSLLLLSNSQIEISRCRHEAILQIIQRLYQSNIFLNRPQVLITVYNASIYVHFNNTIAFDSLKLVKMFLKYIYNVKLITIIIMSYPSTFKLPDQSFSKLRMHIMALELILVTYFVNHSHLCVCVCVSLSFLGNGWGKNVTGAMNTPATIK